MNLLSIQDELVAKITKKELDITSLKVKLEKQGNASIAFNKDKASSENLFNPAGANIVNTQEKEPQESIPLEKYHHLLNNLVQEQEKMKKITNHLEQTKK